MAIRLRTLPKGMRAATGPIPATVKRRRHRLPPAFAPRPVDNRITPGRVLLRVAVAGKAVPWRAPIHGKGHAYSPAHVKAWKEHVARTIEAAGYGESRGILPYAGPVRAVVWVCRACTRGRVPGERWIARPDIDNLFKGLGDSLSGNVFKASGKHPQTGEPIPARLMPPSPVGRVIADDNQVADIDVRKRYWHEPLAWIELTAVAPLDPGPYPFDR